MLGARMDGEDPLGRLARQTHDLPLRAEPPGRRSSATSSISSVSSFLLNLFASWHSSRHHSDASHASETRNRAASQRVAASSSARAERLLLVPAVGVEIEEDVVLSAPALVDHPIVQRARPVVVLARTTDEEAGQD